MPGVRALEATAAAGLAPGTLMDRAGDAAFRLAIAVAPHARRVWIACGPGNNGGDGLACALRLHAAGLRVVVTHVAGDPSREPEDARRTRQAAIDAGVAFVPAAPALEAGDLAIDALLGIGAARPPAGRIATQVQALLAVPCTVLALDLPTGLDADTGRAAPGATVVADHTLTFLVAKPGLFTGDGRDHAGRVWLADLGVEPGAAQSDAPAPRLAGRPTDPRRRRHRDHKGSLGDVLVIGGAPGMAGAAELAARAAHAAGAGRVYLHPLDGVGPAARPEIMRLVPAPATGATLAAASMDRTVVAGCGGGQAIAALLPSLLGMAARLVLDADALNAIAADASLQRLLRQRTAGGQPTVLTPHPLEAARLLATGTADVQADRLAAARTLAASTGATVVLKGSGSLIADPGQGLLVNPTGGPALATPGSGDVLAGWIAGLWAGAGTADAFACARAAVWWHGLAADAVSAGPLRAVDLIEAMWAARERAARADDPGA